MLSLFNELKTQNNKNYKYLLPATVSAIFLVIIISISRSNSDGNSGNPVNVSISSYDGIFEDLGIENLILDGSESEGIENPIAIKYSDNLIFETPGLELEGNNIDKVTHAPIEIKFSNRKADTFYTILMLDTDAPSRQNNTASPWLHWLIINLQGASTDIGLLKTGQTITSYHAPTPPANSGWHRYTFLVFEQENKVTSEMIEVSLQPVIAKRNNFDLLKFLEIVPGEIVGVEMFRTEKFENKTIIGRAESVN